mgnify:CR=1 FL=1
MDIIRKQADNHLLRISRKEKDTSSIKLGAHPQQKIEAEDSKEYYGSNSMGYKFK